MKVKVLKPFTDIKGVLRWPPYIGDYPKEYAEKLIEGGLAEATTGKKSEDELPTPPIDTAPAEEPTDKKSENKN